MPGTCLALFELLRRHVRQRAASGQPAVADDHLVEVTVDQDVVRRKAAVHHVMPVYLLHATRGLQHETIYRYINFEYIKKLNGFDTGRMQGKNGEVHTSTWLQAMTC